MEIRGFFLAGGWDAFRSLPYDGYVIMDATVNMDKTLNLRHVVEAYPNADRIEQAMAYARECRLTPLTTGSHLVPKAEVYVIFYETYSDPDQAIVFAKQTNVMGFVGSAQYNYLTVFTY